MRVVVGAVGSARGCTEVVFQEEEAVRARKGWALELEADQVVVLKEMRCSRGSGLRVEALEVMLCLCLAYAREPFGNPGLWVMRVDEFALRREHRRGD